MEQLQTARTLKRLEEIRHREPTIHPHLHSLNPIAPALSQADNAPNAGLNKLLICKFRAMPPVATLRESQKL
jgi:hypothetical protein